MREEVRHRSRNWQSCDLDPSDLDLSTEPGQENYDQIMQEFLGFQ